MGRTADTDVAYHAPVTPALVAELQGIVGADRVTVRRSELLPLASDGLPTYKMLPGVAVSPGTRDEVIAVVRALHRASFPFVARGAGTGLSGGALADGIALLSLNRLNRILEINATDMFARVEPGVVNARLSRETARFGAHYAPDPSSQTACTLGGNVAENSGGPHCMKYGVTLNHVLEVEVVLADGRVVRFGNRNGENTGYDLLGAFVGSEGCFGVALEATVRLTKDPEVIRTFLADFASVAEAANAVSAIVAGGIVPAALEMLDAGTIRAVESSIYAAGYPTDAAAVLLVELDGEAQSVNQDAESVHRLLVGEGARSIRVADTPAERSALWQGRKKAFGAMGRVAPSLVVQDAVVPRTRLADVLEGIERIAEREGLVVCNVFHAGDGNLHPNIPYDPEEPGVTERVERAMTSIMELCLGAGGSVTGEHGIGLDKLRYMDLAFSEDSLAAMCTLRTAFDPEHLANPGKVVPLRSCREWNTGSGRRWDAVSGGKSGGVSGSGWDGASGGKSGGVSGSRWDAVSGGESGGASGSGWDAASGGKSGGVSGTGWDAGVVRERHDDVGEVSEVDVMAELGEPQVPQVPQVPRVPRVPQVPRVPRVLEDAGEAGEPQK